MQFSSALLRAALLAVLVTTMTGPGCGEDTVEAPRQLYLRVTSDATPGDAPIASLRVLMTKGDAVYPTDKALPAFNPRLGALDIRKEPLLLSVAYDGATFGDGDAVTVEVVGLGATATSFLVRGEAKIDLAYAGFVDVKLKAMPSGCDADGDGFFDCTVAGCCDAASPFGDCEPSDASANPWGTEAACEPCADTVDQDCRGGDTACVDADNDLIADCEETECGAGDGTVGPGLTEICDGKDNNCDSSTDEGWALTYRGAELALGDACGVGACLGGVVACDDVGGIHCTGEANRAAEETCNNQIDDDCDGDTDEECPVLDVDNDTFTVDDGDCNDNDNTIYPEAPELCDGKDNDCNDSTDEGFEDLDGDNIADCVDDDIDGDEVLNETDNCPLIANQAQADIDGDALGDACDPCNDVDGDGFGRGGLDVNACRGGPAVDCDDTLGNTQDPDEDNLCGAADNCPQHANADQADLDEDDIGDACDPCVDVDDDGFGRGGLDLASCRGGPAPDCDDTADNVADPDGDNVCAPNDNCPNDLNADQADGDGDGIGDVCDPCTDADNDGWGLAGTNRAQCSNGIAVDCNDATGNTDDPDHDNVCGSNDNCPNVPNPAQTNVDGDSLGDVCDPCVDADGDGFGRGGTNMAACPSGPGDDCNDDPNNTEDPDRDNVCGADDNCPATANANQADVDLDEIGDACDVCVDADGDGWGQGGTDPAQCENGADVDCNDTLGNTSDADADNVCAPNDNCPNTSNPDQANTDGDSFGDVCDTCIDADNDGWGRSDTNRTACSKGNAVDCNDVLGNTDDPDADNVCGSNDNCPAVANPTQTNIDADLLGDACDPCVDVDGDGWGRGGTSPAQCPRGAAVDCDDTVANVADLDSDNVCGADDNCPALANATQANTDGDTFGDACDNCIDVDGDGFGRGGLDVELCPGGSEMDCDDTFGNELDPDGDNDCDPFDNCPLDSNSDQADSDDNGIGDVCDFVCPGDADNDDVCDSGRGVKCDETDVRNCDDNCVGTPNPLQYDSDGDGFGDACDEPLEICTDCIDNDHNAITDTGDACAYRRYVAVVARSSAIPVGHPLSLTFDHAFLVGAGRSTASGADLRIFYVNPTTQVWEELDRVIDDAPGPDNAYTTVWFASQAAINANEADANYRLVHGGAVNLGMLPPADPAAIFTVWDDFARPASATVGGEWLELESTGNTVSIAQELSQEVDVFANGSLRFTSNNSTLRPVATLPFDAVDSGRHLWRIGWNWINNNEGTYSIVMQLGDSTHVDWNASPTTMTEALGGSGPTIIWAGNAFGASSGQNLMFGYPANSVNVSLGVRNAKTDIYVLVDVDNDSFQVYPSATGDAWSAPIPFRNNIGQLDRLRLFTDGVTTTNFVKSQFEYIGLQPVTDSGQEPFAFVGLKEPMACAALGSPTVRYYLDDVAGSPTLADTGSGTAANLTVTTASVVGGTLTQPLLGSITDLAGLTFFTNRAGGKAEVVMTGNGAPAAKLTSAMDRSRTGTIEVVIEPYEAPAANQTVTFASIQEGSKKRFSLTLRGGATAGAPAQVVFYGEDNVRGVWDLDIVAARRTVLHLVFDDAVSNSRFTLYRDGSARVPVGTLGDIGDLRINNTNSFYVGNVPSLDESPKGFIYYVAMYSSALTSAQTLRNWRVLEANDDTPSP